MKATGIVRKIDELGRIVLPIELRRSLRIDIGDAVEIYVDPDKIMLKKYTPACLFCGNFEDMTYFRGKMICKGCFNEMTEETEKPVEQQDLS
ncbi:AbrB/MazE/SpoVT family DNA-binding domain-containing protein [Paenibacillus eucommiae]|uniref:Transcriptional pleiotropic regulator of transition state genes n=1 Tax=Paenibacillus eucommiae TaxID=1355755 RepID=A0ABS4J0T0_9BACL|nr:AbrB/MazE/SpoVT family DNA-binding domain-containing protein [Paenibacillus eucommiae]MBP1993425.1 transcriptional pleiotropic regulator of transition state genes [Paenibacillus eucommiae]